MARITHVKSAQQRFHTVPVIDEATGLQKKTPVMKTVVDRETGETSQVQKTTKSGRPVFLSITTEDRSKPKDPYTCDACKGTIHVGTPYKHISPKSGPYGGRKLTRHESCPTWQVWEYSSSMSARLAEIAHNFWGDIENVESPDDVTSALSDAAESIRSLAEEKHESASNIEEGFGHPTSASEELEGVADELESWADEVESADVPEPDDCATCDGEEKRECDLCEDGWVETAAVQSGEASEQIECEECEATGLVECEECTDGKDMDAWREELPDALSIVDESPV